MPGSVSDSFDPEWSTSSNKEDIEDALNYIYKRLSDVLGNKKPIYILDLVHTDPDKLGPNIRATLSEKEWRLLRFAVERAKESL